MVSLSVVKSSNSLIASTLPPGLVAVFIGATSGIGEITLKKFAEYANKPRVYFVGRSIEAGERIAAECKKSNPAGEFTFIKSDVSLIRNVDEVCDMLKTKEKFINLLFLSAGEPSMDRSQTSEHLHLITALVHYSRSRFATTLLALLQQAPSLRRVISVGGGTLEGPLDTNDFPALHVPLLKIRSHIITLVTLGLEAVAKTAPEVSFVHAYPGTVDTRLATRMQGVIGWVVRAHMWLLGRWVCVPLEECGERHLFLATSERFPPKQRAGRRGFDVPLGEGVEVASGTTGEIGSGVYSVGWDGESGSPATLELLAGLRERGMVEDVWRHTEGEFKRITESQ